MLEIPILSSFTSGCERCRDPDVRGNETRISKNRYSYFVENKLYIVTFLTACFVIV